MKRTVKRINTEKYTKYNLSMQKKKASDKIISQFNSMNVNKEH